ncbi:hypothetical protein LKM00_26380 [Bacillus wiedmannii]|uniref:hypothetical protein n=1 Tax=Bacillus wiedmannii TaxID=1890302 RepID=UPI001E443D63|nr:hypothetical protein [Bacillus wiedmannii]MCC2380928.1 hypothetical protein [Bacillus wiedmannii]MCC2425391.1 hypothetical protein [Bacillus wiedmannii]
MNDRCIVCGRERGVQKTDDLLLCSRCRNFRPKEQINSFDFIDNLIQKKESDASALTSIPLIRNPNTTKPNPNQEEIDNLLKEAEILKKHPSVRLKYIF